MSTVALEPLLPHSSERSPRSPSSPRLEGPGWSTPPSPFVFALLTATNSKGRRRAVIVVVLLLGIAIMAGFLFKLDDDAFRTLMSHSWKEAVGTAAHLALKPGHLPGEHSEVDSLRSDRRYITSFSLAGFNNQNIGAMNLLHLAFLLQQKPYPLPHVVVLPPVSPHYAHLKATGEAVVPYPFSSIYDLPAFERTTGIAVVGWHDIKDLDTVQDFEGAAREDVACWAPWWTQFSSPISGYTMERRLGLQRILTPLPPSLLTPTDLNPSHVLFSQVASLLSPPDNALRRDFLSGWSGDADRLTDRWGRGNESWTTAWGPSVAGWREPEGLNEGELVCMDALYFATERGEEVRNLYEGRPGRGQYGPWSTVGRHLFFARPLKAKAEAIVRTVLSLSARAKLPHFFTMHIRRGDFLEECQPEWPCLRLVQYETHLRTLQEQLSSAGLNAARTWPVVVTTDETDPAYLAEIKIKGWHLIDHDAFKTKEKMGHWGPTLIDVVALSLGKGFVGTAGSTMSILTLRRVEDWNGGVTSLVRKDEHLEPPASP